MYYLKKTKITKIHTAHHYHSS